MNNRLFTRAFKWIAICLVFTFIFVKVSPSIPALATQKTVTDADVLQVNCSKEESVSNPDWVFGEPVVENGVYKGCKVEIFATGENSVCDFGFFFSTFFEGLNCMIMESLRASLMETASLWIEYDTNIFNEGVKYTAPQITVGEGQFNELLQYVKWGGLVAAAFAGMFLIIHLLRRADEWQSSETMYDKLTFFLVGVALLGLAPSIVNLIFGDTTLYNVASNMSGWIQGALWPYMMLILALSLIVAYARGTYSHDIEGIKGTFELLLKMVFVVACSTGLFSIVADLSDEFSKSILEASGKTIVENAEFALTPFAFGGDLIVGVGWLFFAIIFGLLGLLLSGIQVVLIIFRSVVCAILLGILPITVAAGGFKSGQNMFPRTLGYLIAIILYKPAASIIYAAMNLVLAPDAGRGLFIQLIVTIVCLFIATFGMSYLVKLVAPQVGGLASSFSLGGQALMAGATIATGGIAGAAAGMAGASGMLSGIFGKGGASKGLAAGGSGGSGGAAGGKRAGGVLAQNTSVNDSAVAGAQSERDSQTMDSSASGGLQKGGDNNNSTSGLRIGTPSSSGASVSDNSSAVAGAQDSGDTSIIRELKRQGAQIKAGITSSASVGVSQGGQSTAQPTSLGTSQSNTASGGSNNDSSVVENVETQEITSSQGSNQGSPSRRVVRNIHKTIINQTNSSSGESDIATGGDGAV
jgi:hypothetical protein